MHALLSLFRPLPNIDIQNLGVCGMYNLRKPTEAFKSHCQVAESRTGKPAMVTLTVELDCFTVHDTTEANEIEEGLKHD